MVKESKKNMPPEQFEAFIADALVELYVRGEETQSDLAMDIGGSDFKSKSSAINEILSRMKFDSQSRSSGFVDDLNAVAEQQFLVQIESEDIRRRVQISALEQAVAYWQDRLSQPDLRPSEILLGRRRLTVFSGRLENFGVSGTGNDF